MKFSYIFILIGCYLAPSAKSRPPINKKPAIKFRETRIELTFIQVVGFCDFAIVLVHARWKASDRIEKVRCNFSCKSCPIQSNKKGISFRSYNEACPMRSRKIATISRTLIRLKAIKLRPCVPPKNIGSGASGDNFLVPQKNRVFDGHACIGQQRVEAERGHCPKPASLATRTASRAAAISAPALAWHSRCS